MDAKRTIYFNKIIDLSILSPKQQVMFKYFSEHPLATVNEIIDIIIRDNPNYASDPSWIMNWNKIPSQLERLQVLQHKGQRDCKSSLTKNRKKAKTWDITYSDPKKIKKLNRVQGLLLNQAKNACMLAVEIHNKPKLGFKTESFITLMINAWTKLLHAYLSVEKIDYHYAEIVDKQKKTWDFKKCVTEADKIKPISAAVKANLEFFRLLRNKVEHSYLDMDIDGEVFPECQALLYNFETFVVENFGYEFSLNESLVFSLQFSTLRDEVQMKALNRQSQVRKSDILKFIDDYRTQLNSDIAPAQEYSIRLIAMPQIDNTGRKGLGVEFVNWSSLSEEQRSNVEKLYGIVKNKTVSVSNLNKLKPGEAILKISKEIGKSFNQHNFQIVCSVFSIRPYGKEKNMNPYMTNSKYCIYDGPHKDYIYDAALVDLIARKMKSGDLNLENLKKDFKNNKKRSIKELESK